jgi:hypothetical protein
MIKNYLFLFAVSGIMACGPEQTDDAPIENPAAEEPVPSHSCDPIGTGNSPGDQIADASFVNCYGDRVSIQTSCGEKKLTVLAIGALWCGACKGYFRGLTYDFAISGGENANWDYYIIEGQDNSRSPDISSEECMAYAAEIEADPARVLIDPNWNRTFGGLINACPTNGSFSLPFMAILDNDDFTYEYSRSCGGVEDDRTNWRESFLGELSEE